MQDKQNSMSISQGRSSIHSNTQNAADPKNMSGKSAAQLEEMLMKTNKDNE